MRILTAIAALAAVVAGAFAPPAGAAGDGSRAVVGAIGADLHGERLRLGLALSRPVSFGLFTLDDPPRLVLDLPAVEWRADEGAPPAYIRSIRRGLYRPGEARVVFDLIEPVRVERAFMLPPLPGRDPRLVIDLVPTDRESFTATAGWPEDRRWTGATGPQPRILVAIDPGHGGHDPGATFGGVVEKELVMSFARDLQQAIAETPGFGAVLTRDDDSYVPLARRIGRARDAGADLMISVHADRLAEGRADGVSVYSLGWNGRPMRSEQAVTGTLIRSRDRANLVEGSDLAGDEDDLARLVVGLARRSTGPASERLAASLLAALGEAEVALLASRPHRKGAFTVLKAADLPAVLIELGFLDSEIDRNRFRSADWQRKTLGAIIRGIENWAGRESQPTMASN